MKRMLFYTTTTFILLLAACKAVDITNTIVYTDNSSSGKSATISLTNGDDFNHPTYVIWTEDMEGNYLKTIFITKSYASGIFGHKMLGDSMWMDISGGSFQPAALPYWTHKKGLINDKYLIPTPEHPYVDAYSGATPQAHFELNTKLSSDKTYRLFLEVNQAWDWNKYWTNNKYPDNEAYKHSAQPSIIYASTMNENETEYFLNPIGHGDVKGESGKLFTDISTLTSAKNIFKEIKIQIK